MHDDYGSTAVMAPVSSGYSMTTNSSFLYSDRSALDYEKRRVQLHGLSRDDEERLGNVEGGLSDNMEQDAGHAGNPRKLSDVHLASRRAEEAASRRAQAAAWLQKMVGPLDLSTEPSEEELRQCLRNGLVLCNVLNRVQPAAAVKVVESPAPCTPDEGAHSAYQYFENVRNFVVALEQLGLPTFEASDLEEVSYLPGSSAKVVDSVIALKQYSEGSGFWKYGVPVKSPRLSGGKGFSSLSTNGAVRSPSLLSQTSMSKANQSQPRNRRPLPDSDGLEDGEILSPDSADQNGYQNSHKAGRISALAIPQGNGHRKQNGAPDVSLESENLSSPNVSDSTALWIQHIGFRIREVLQGKAKRVQGYSDSDDKENSGAMNGYDDAPSQSLLSLVSAIIGDKHPEEVPMLVEFILRKVMEEFERRLHTQGEQVKKMTNALKEILAREEKLTSRAKVLEALAAGTGEEVKTKGLLTSQPVKSFNIPTINYLVNDSPKEFGSLEQGLQKDLRGELCLPHDESNRCSWASYGRSIPPASALESVESNALSLDLCSQVKTPLFGWPHSRHLDDQTLARSSPWLKSLSQEFLDLQKYLPLCPSRRSRMMEKKQIEEEKKTKEEDIGRLMRDREEKQVTVDVLRNELEVIKRADQEQQIQLQLQKKEMEMEANLRLQKVENRLLETKRRAQVAEAGYVSELKALRQKSKDYEGAMWLQKEIIQELRSVLERTREETLKMQHGWTAEMDILGTEMSSIAKAAAGYHKVLEENRQLYNEVQDLKGNIRVYCRVRPFFPNQSMHHSTVDFVGDSGDLIIVNPNKQGKDARKMFSFNKVFDASASQEQVFVDTQPLIRSVLDGFNVCIFAYGQTGSGKTYTMSGPNIASEEDWGVNYRALNDLFKLCQSRNNAIHYEVGVQMIEIYNEQVRDLFVSDGSAKRLEIRNKSQLNGLNVPDANMMPVHSTADVLELMKIGQKNRAVGATALNERSSRSHSVLTVHVQGTDLESGTVLRGCLHLVDLAGSERVDKSEATGDRLKEAQHINKSLSALGDVIAALAQKNAHVPYRNSKLTQLLQDSLGGQAKTLMFVHISPEFDSYGETMSTLKFAERVATVELGAARSHRESGDIKDLKEQIASLKDLLAKKDGEIDRLTKEAKAHGGDAVNAGDKPRVKIGSSPFNSRRQSMNGGEVAYARSRKQSNDAALSHEGPQLSRASLDRAAKQRGSLTISLSQDGSSEDHDPESPLDSPSGQRLSSDDGHSNGKPHQAQRRGASVRSSSPDSDPPPATLVESNHYKQRIARNKQEANSKEWQDRIESSMRLPLPSGSLDENSHSWNDGGELPKQDGDLSAGVSLRPVPSPANGAGSGTRAQEDVPSRDSVLVSSGEAAESTGVHANGSIKAELKKDTDAPAVDASLNDDTLRREAEGEDRSDFSEGELSQGTDASSATLNDQLVPTRKEDSVSKKHHQAGERRSQFQSQIPRPPAARSDRRQSTSEQPQTRTRRLSMTGISEPRRVSSVGTRTTGADANAQEDVNKAAATRHPSGTPQQKSSKRWL